MSDANLPRAAQRLARDGNPEVICCVSISLRKTGVIGAEPVMLNPAELDHVSRRLAALADYIILRPSRASRSRSETAAIATIAAVLGRQWRRQVDNADNRSHRDEAA